MYGYLDKENDWLNFSNFSMLIKNTNYKPHNVFGYVHFEDLNENESNLKISNERAYFIENGAFKKFQEIMKNFISNLAFNIDVAERNGSFNKIQHNPILRNNVCKNTLQLNDKKLNTQVQVISLQNQTTGSENNNKISTSKKNVELPKCQ